jgi:4-carboxymuconolactone decarboxylase
MPKNRVAERNILKYLGVCLRRWPCWRISACGFCLLLAISASAQNRMPEIPAEKLTPAQKKAAEEVMASRGGSLSGPFVALLRSPEVMLGAKGMGDYLRFKTVLPPKLREFVIVIVAREWTQRYEWHSHSELAMQAGLSEETVKAIAAGRRPQRMSDDEEAIYDFCTELHANHSVSDATYARALEKFGEQGIVDMVGVNGYYTFLSMLMNVARTPAPQGAKHDLVVLPN